MEPPDEVPDFMTVADFLHWMPPEGQEKHRWHALYGRPVLMPPLGIEQSALHCEAAYVISAHVHHQDAGARVAMMAGIHPAGSDYNLWVASVGVTQAAASASGERIMQDPIAVVEILTPDNAALVEIGVVACKAVPTIQEILLLDSHRVCAALHQRAPGGGLEPPTYLFTQQRLRLQSIGVEIELDRFYQCVDLRKMMDGGA